MKKVYYLKHKERILELRKKQYIANPLKYIQKSKIWSVRNPGKVKLYKNRWEIKNRKSKNLKNLIWAKNNREKVQKIYQKYIANKIINGGSYTLEEWQRLLKRFDNKCLKCHQQIKLEKDHIVPISMGGSNNINNLQPLCRSCNARKHNKIQNYIEKYLFEESFLNSEIIKDIVNIKLL